MGLSDHPFWALWTLVVPLFAGGAALLWPQRSSVIGPGAALLTGIAVAGTLLQLLAHGPQQFALGGWDTPLGIHLHLDGPAMLMLLITALVGLPVSLYARDYFAGSVQQARFWPLWLLLWAGMNALYLSADLFNLYVTLELVSLTAVALVALAGQAAVRAALRYLLVSLLGSLCFLLAVALLYGAYGALDMTLLAERLEVTPLTALALALMTLGLLLKSALFPLHGWLPPAHAGAPAPVSALLSALVVKASFYLLLLLWLVLYPPLVTGFLTGLIGWLGVAAILWGSVQALRTARLKQLVAYSTVAQLGYIGLALTLIDAAPWQPILVFILAHACAKAAMFLAAGNIQQVAGHDRLATLSPALRASPLSVFAFALAGISLIGLPPSGGFLAKWLLLGAALDSGRFAVAVALVGGGLLTAAYVFRALGRALRPGTGRAFESAGTVSPLMAWSTLGLGLLSIALGFSGVGIDRILMEWPG